MTCRFGKNLWGAFIFGQTPREITVSIILHNLYGELWHWVWYIELNCISHRQTLMDDVRKSDRCIWDSPEEAERIWNRIKSYVPEVFKNRKRLELNERWVHTWKSYDLNKKRSLKEPPKFLVILHLMLYTRFDLLCKLFTIFSIWTYFCCNNFTMWILFPERLPCKINIYRYKMFTVYSEHSEHFTLVNNTQYA